MNLFFSVTASFIGLIFGSFFNVLIFRWNTEGAPSPVTGRSFCPHCKHPLAWNDLIPLYSYLSLGGRCRYCGEKISLRYPVVEISSALVFLITFAISPLSPFILITNLIVVSMWLVIFYSDIIYGLIPDQAVIILGIGALSNFLNGGSGFELRLFCATVFPLIFALIIKLSRGRAMGWGDVKLLIPQGFLLGWPGTGLALWLGFVSGGFAGIILLLLKRKRVGETIPLGPFLIAGAAIAYFYGKEILPGFFGLYLN